VPSIIAPLYTPAHPAGVGCQHCNDSLPLTQAAIDGGIQWDMHKLRTATGVSWPRPPPPTPVTEHRPTITSNLAVVAAALLFAQFSFVTSVSNACLLNVLFLHYSNCHIGDFRRSEAHQRSVLRGLQLASFHSVSDDKLPVLCQSAP